MKILLKLIVFLIISAILLPSLSQSADALGYQSRADSLKRMGLFKGTNNGDELDRAATRAEAAVMLVRLLGEESDAQRGTYPHPFKDVPIWAAPYVGYLYQHGLAKGTSANTFSPGVACSAHMFIVFALRALGYTEDNGSFTYAQARDFAVQLGLVDVSDNPVTFLRDNMVALSYSTLFQKEKNSSNLLLERLVSDHAVSDSTALAPLQEYKTYQNYIKACDASYLDISSKFSTQVNSVFTDAPTNHQTYYTNARGTTTLVSGDKIAMLFGGYETDIQGYLQHYTSYYADGWLYTRSGPRMDVYTKKRADISKSDYIAMVNPLHPLPFYMTDGVSESHNDGKTSYFISYSPYAFRLLLKNEVARYSDKFADYLIQKPLLREDTDFGSDGKLLHQKIEGYIETTWSKDYRTMTLDIIREISVVDIGDDIYLDVPTNLWKYKLANS